MEIQKVKHELKLEEWRKVIHECRNSGQTVRAWCKEHQVCPQTYYRWQREIWDMGTKNLPEITRQQSILPEAVTFTECSIATSPHVTSAAIILRLNSGVSLEIQNGVSQETMVAVLNAVRALC